MKEFIENIENLALLAQGMELCHLQREVWFDQADQIEGTFEEGWYMKFGEDIRVFLDNGTKAEALMFYAAMEGWTPKGIQDQIDSFMEEAFRETEPEMESQKFAEVQPDFPYHLEEEKWWT